MTRKLLLLAVLFGLTVDSAYPQSRSSDSTRQLKAGEVVQLSDSLTARVTRSATSPFTQIKTTGNQVVVVLDFDAGKKGATLSYKLTADPKFSDVYLTIGTQKIAPLAVIEDFRSWGSDNDKEVELLDPADKSGGVILTFEQKGSVSLLFDVPLDQART
ncbi:MAG: hypothetical protein WAV47_23715, partial [Blastocatellia bacterium]